MEARYYYNVLLKKLWIILLIPLICGAAATYYSYETYVPVFEANSTLLVVNNDKLSKVPSIYYDVLAGQQLVKEYKEIIKSRSVAKEVIKQLNIDQASAADIMQNVSVSLKAETRILEIRVRNKSAERAKNVANKVAEVFINRLAQFTQEASVVVIDQAEAPANPVKPEHLRNILVAVMAGFAISIALVFIIEDLDDTIKTAEDVENYLGLKVLGTLPRLTTK